MKKTMVIGLMLIFSACSVQQVEKTAKQLWDLKFSDIVAFFSKRHKSLKIFISSEPKGALVYQDQTNGYPEVFGMTPFYFKFKTGNYILKFKLKDYQVAEVDFNPQQTNTVYVILSEEKEEPSVLGSKQRPKNSMVFVKGGRYQMGDNLPMNFKGYQPLRDVVVSSFYISRYEVTYGEYDKYCESESLPRPKIIYENYSRRERPVGNVSWQEALLYCNWRSIKEGFQPVYEFSRQSGRLKTVHWDATGYRLPTEAEWEYAARGGNKSHKTLYAGSGDINEVAWYDKNSDIRTHPVGLLKPNELGLYDMSGNAAELCWDFISYTSTRHGEILTNPRGPSTGEDKVERGGNSYLQSQYIRIPFRMSVKPGEQTDSVGFRLVRNKM